MLHKCSLASTQGAVLLEVGLKLTKTYSWVPWVIYTVLCRGPQGNTRNGEL